MRLFPAVLLGASIVPSLAHAQTVSPWSLAKALDTPDSLALAGSVRLRYETIEDQARAGFNSNDQLVNLRTIVSVGYNTGPLRLGLELVDSRAWSANAGTPLSTGEVNVLEPVQAYVAFDVAAPFGSRTTARIQAGRFKLDLGSRRLIADDDYRNTTNSFTGIRGDLSLRGGVKATAIYVLPQTRLPDDAASLRANRATLDRETFNTVLWGAMVGRPIGGTTAEVSFYHFGERDAAGRPTRDRSIDSWGIRLFRAPQAGRADHDIEAIVQTGRASANLTASAALQPLRAAFGHAEWGYMFPMRWNPHLSLEFDYASGDRSSGSYGRFDPLFGMRRADFSPAGLYNAIQRTNLITPGIRVEVAPGKRTDAFLSYRAMWLASPIDSFATTGVRDPLGRSGRFAGHQIEGRVRYWLVPAALRFEASGALLSKGQFLTQAPNAPVGRTTRYLSLNLTGYF